MDPNLVTLCPSYGRAGIFWPEIQLVHCLFNLSLSLSCYYQYIYTHINKHGTAKQKAVIYMDFPLQLITLTSFFYFLFLIKPAY